MSWKIGLAYRGTLQIVLVAERSSRSFWDSSPVRAHPRINAELESPRVPAHYTARCECSSSRVLRATALQSKPMRCLAVYGANQLTDQCRTLFLNSLGYRPGTGHQGSRPLGQSGRTIHHRPPTIEAWEFLRPVAGATICTAHSRTIDASGAATAYTGRVKLSLTTALRSNAQAKCRIRYRTAHSHHRSRPGVTLALPNSSEDSGGQFKHCDRMNRS